MTVTELLPVLHRLSRADKLCVMQFLVSELAREEAERGHQAETPAPAAEEPCCPIWAGGESDHQEEPLVRDEPVWNEPVWTPQESFAAARSLVRQLKEEALQAQAAQEQEHHNGPPDQSKG
jgi:hypothetical protein